MITNELRKYVWDKVPSKHLEDLIDIADAIEQKHEEELAVQSESLSVGMKLMTDEFLDEYGLVRLPRDADGVTIRAGDKLDGYNKAIEVVELRYGRSGWILISRDGNAYSDTAAFAHVKPDSWEAIIEAAASYGDKRLYTGTQGDKANIAELVERCKRLAGEDA